jgi:hypothetical protein
VFAPGDLVKVADVEALIVLAVQGEQSLHLGHRRPLGGRRAAPPVVEIIDAIPFELQPQATHAPGTAPQDVARLDPGQLARQRLQDHVAHCHGALHSAQRIGHGHPLGGHCCHWASWSGHFTCQTRPHHVSPTRPPPVMLLASDLSGLILTSDLSGWGHQAAEERRTRPEAE